MEYILDTLIGISLASLTWFFLRFASGRRSTLDSTGSLVMRHSAPLRWFVAIAAFAFGIVLPWYELGENLALSETLAFAGIGLLACIALLYFNLLRIEISREGIQRLRPWRLNISWPDIAKLEANLEEKHFLITTKSGKRMSVHFALTGMDVFIEMVKANLAPEVYEQAQEAFAWFPSRR